MATCTGQGQCRVMIALSLRGKKIKNLQCHLKTNIDNMVHSFIMSTNEPQQPLVMYDCWVHVTCKEDGLTCASMSTEGYRGSMEGGETVLMGVCTDG